MIYQSTDTVLVIVPSHFCANPETRSSNEFQKKTETIGVSELARAETEALIQRLEDEGIEVMKIEDRDNPVCPDAVFPNNWLGVHPGGHLFLYRMEAPSRRNEVRPELASMLAAKYPGIKISDLRIDLESKDQVLEGTGSMVFDHLQKTVYAALSGRTSREAVIEIASKLGYKPLVFRTMTASETPVYHTNVLLSIGTGFAIVASEVVHEEDREAVLAELRATGRTIIEISLTQMERFAANVLELRNSAGEKLIVISSTSVKALEASQLAALQNHGLLLETDVPVIEQNGGGSVRCMIAEIFH